MQSNRFAHLPVEAQTNFARHVQAHEMFMWKIAQTNPAYSEKLGMLPQWPLLYTPETSPSTATEQEMGEEIATEEAIMEQNLTRPLPDQNAGPGYIGQEVPVQDPNMAQAPPDQVSGEPISAPQTTPLQPTSAT
jgi:hypothetical protein